MDKLIASFGVVVVFFGGMIVVIPLGTLFGGIAGHIVGLFFGDTVLKIFDQLGVYNITMFQLGAFLGFVGGFLRTKTEANVKSK